MTQTAGLSHSWSRHAAAVPSNELCKNIPISNFVTTSFSDCICVTTMLNPTNDPPFKDSNPARSCSCEAMIVNAAAYWFHPHVNRTCISSSNFSHRRRISGLRWLVRLLMGLLPRPLVRQAFDLRHLEQGK